MFGYNLQALVMPIFCSPSELTQTSPSGDFMLENHQNDTRALMSKGVNDFNAQNTLIPLNQQQGLMFGYH